MIDENRKLFVVAAIVLCMSLFGWFRTYDVYYYNYKYTGFYVKAEGKLLFYKVKTTYSRGVNRSRDVKVEYFVGGQRCICRRIAWGIYDDDESYDWLSKLRKNEPVDVYYVPEHPEIAVLDPMGMHGEFTPDVVHFNVVLFICSLVLFLSIPTRSFLFKIRMKRMRNRIRSQMKL